MMAVLADYALNFQRRYAQFEDMAIGIQSAVGAAHSGVMSVLGPTPLTDLTNIVVDELGEAVDRVGEIFAGSQIGRLYIGRWVDRMSDVARRARPFEMSGPRKWTCRSLGMVRRPDGTQKCAYKCVDEATGNEIDEYRAPRQQGPTQRSPVCPKTSFVEDQLSWK